MASATAEGVHSLEWRPRSGRHQECWLIEPGRLSPPIWPCTTRGFPCLRCRHRSGGLLPHLFTLAKRCVHFEDVPQVSLRDATVLRSAGGLFSLALSVTAPHCFPTWSGRHPPKRLTLPRGSPRVARPLTLSRAFPCQ